jgi:hypothetical protein
MIILLGLPKSGTTSFDSLFKELGYKTYHWLKDDQYVGTFIRNNKDNGLPLLTGFEPDSCITQMDVCMSESECFWPQITDYCRIYHENPDAIYILNKRDPVKVLASFKKWKGYINRLYMFNPELVHPQTDYGFIEFVRNHYSRIQSFFAMHPEAKFITYDIDKDRIEKLSRYIDLNGIKTFPWKNKTPRDKTFRNFRS